MCARGFSSLPPTRTGEYRGRAKWLTVIKTEVVIYNSHWHANKLRRADFSGWDSVNHIFFSTVRFAHADGDDGYYRWEVVKQKLREREFVNSIFGQVTSRAPGFWCCWNRLVHDGNWKSFLCLFLIGMISQKCCGKIDLPCRCYYFYCIVCVCLKIFYLLFCWGWSSGNVCKSEVT